MTHQVHVQLADESRAAVRTLDRAQRRCARHSLPALQFGAQHRVLRPNRLDRVGAEREAKRRPTPA